MTIGSVIDALNGLKKSIFEDEISSEVIGALKEKGYYRGFLHEFSCTKDQIFRRNLCTGKMTFYSVKGNANWKED